MADSGNLPAAQHGSASPQLTVVCVLRSGGIYTPEWVSKLRNGVAKHLHRRHRFVCISDTTVDCERIPLTKDWPGWWAKMAAFEIAGPVLFLDLDTVIVAPINDVAEHAMTGGFTMIRDWHSPEYHGSGVMSWSGDMTPIYNEFASDAGRLMTVKRKRVGDQGLIEEMVPAHTGNPVACWQDVTPRRIASYKVDCVGRGIPAGASIVCLHGVPKFRDMPERDPVRMAWEAL